MTVNQLLKQLNSLSVNGFGNRSVVVDVESYRQHEKVKYILVEFVIPSTQELVVTSSYGDFTINESVELS